MSLRQELGPRHRPDRPSARVARALVVRHRESTWNAERRWAGQADPPLTEAGEADALHLGVHLAEIGFDAIVASDLVRARRTAELAHRAMPAAVLTFDPRLREIAVPAWTGLTKAQIEEAFPGRLERWRGRTPDPPRGSEPWVAFERRVLAALHDCAQRWGSVLVVAHSGVLRVLTTALQSPHGKIGRSKGVWVEWRDGALQVGPRQRLRASSGR